jgi:predicted MFS family arabinose efflux permease
MYRGQDARRARLAPLMLAAMASQALLVVLAPTIVAVGNDLGASVSAVGQARSVTAAVAIAASAVLARTIDTVATSRLIALGGVLAIIGCGTIATAPTLTAFLLAHVLVGIAVACLLTAGFAGVAAFPQERRAGAIGYVTGANALAWIVVTPIVGIAADWLSWRVALAVPAAIALAALLAAPAAASAARGPTVVRLRTVFSQRSARRWIGAELMAYGAWTALLTFVGAFFLERLSVGEGVVGWLLAGGAAAHFAASTRGGRVSALMPRRRLVAAVSLLMAILFVVELGVSASAAVAVGTFCLLGLLAGVRTPASGGLGLDQLPDHPGTMMAARTAATQLGYLLGAVIGGAVIAGPGYGTLGIVLAAGMVTSAWLMLRVDDPREASTPRAGRVGAGTAASPGTAG